MNNLTSSAQLIIALSVIVTAYAKVAVAETPDLENMERDALIVLAINQHAKITSLDAQIKDLTTENTDLARQIKELEAKIIKLGLDIRSHRDPHPEAAANSLTGKVPTPARLTDYLSKCEQHTITVYHFLRESIKANSAIHSRKTPQEAELGRRAAINMLDEIKSGGLFRNTQLIVSYRKPQVGDIGAIGRVNGPRVCFPISKIEVFQVIDRSTALIKIAFFQDSNEFYEDDTEMLFFVRGVATATWVDEMQLTTLIVDDTASNFIISSTQTYETPLGGSNTVMVIEPASNVVLRAALQDAEQLRKKDMKRVSNQLNQPISKTIGR